MEEIREAALAYYHNLPEDLKNLAAAKFKEIDSNGNGTISMKEFKNSMGSSFDNDSVIIKRSFKELDKNGDGKLDFNEYITLYYLVESDRLLVFCAGRGCEAAPFLKGLYFTCVDCFHHNENETFDLCTSCYRRGEFEHEHTNNFVDNYFLLRSKAACYNESNNSEIVKGRSIDQLKNMEEIREAALAYYHNLPDDLKKQASAKFKEIDSNNSGTINMREFKNSMGSSFDNDSEIIKRSFKELDKNGDGKLDFNEYITLYYLVESDRLLVFCAGHGCEAAPFLKGLYFTCVDCFHHNENETFDLCTSCYRNGDFDHEHTNFVDNHVLLRSKAACRDESISECSSGSDSEVNQVSRSGSNKVPVARSGSNKVPVARSGSKRRAVFGAIKSGVSVARAVGDVASDAASCSIM